jgi:transposase
VADLSYLKPSVLTDYYKNHLSNFLSWDQLSHAEDYILFPENMGPDLCIDETALSNGELVTNVINKSGHGKRGTLVAIIKGTKSENIVKCLKKIPQELRDMVQNITLDMANSMYSIARQSFPNALQIIDRFHVQKLMHEALQDLRIQYRWQAMDQENKAMKKAKENKEEYVPERFGNGDTLKQLLARSRYLLFKSPDKWSQSQEARANILFKQYDDLKEFYYLTLHLGKIYSTSYDKDVARPKLALWFNKVEEWGYPQFNTVIRTFQQHYERILNFFVGRQTNAAAESFNAKLKAFRADFRGVTDMKFFLFRVAKIYA